jgi:hypothetical protein
MSFVIDFQNHVTILKVEVTFTYQPQDILFGKVIITLNNINRTSSNGLERLAVLWQFIFVWLSA